MDFCRLFHCVSAMTGWATQNRRKNTMNWPGGISLSLRIIEVTVNISVIKGKKRISTYINYERRDEFMIFFRKKNTEEKDMVQKQSVYDQDDNQGAQSQERCGCSPFGCRPCPPRHCGCTGPTGPTGPTGAIIYPLRKTFV